jgi:hypothetical protein
MAVPTTNVSLGDIYSEPNGATAANTKASEIMKLTYFQGPGPIGNGDVSFRSWGQYGNTAGSDRIYGLTAGNVNNAFGDFRGLTYYYDNSSYKISADVENTKQPPPGPPSPPYNNDIVVEINLYDSTNTYQYALSGAINVPFQSTSTGNTVSSASTSPIIALGYWEVKVTNNNSFPPGGSIDIQINGTNYGGGGIPDSAQTTFRWDDVGATAAPIASTGQGYDGLYFDITVG